jgi:CBS domain-containing protein
MKADPMDAAPMKAGDVMTVQPVTISPDATIADAVRLMLDRRISGLFVVDATGLLVGVVTEGDLLRRWELGTERERSWWLRLLLSPGRQAADFTRANSRRVGDVMTAEVVMVDGDASLEAVVEAMESHRIKRVAVAQEGRLAGVVSRADLLRALIAQAPEAQPVSADDGTIRDAVLAALKAQSWTPVDGITVTVTDGVVEFTGTITDPQERRALCVLVENVPGVKQVRDQLALVELYTGTVVEAPDEPSTPAPPPVPPLAR